MSGKVLRIGINGAGGRIGKLCVRETLKRFPRLDGIPPSEVVLVACNDLMPVDQVPYSWMYDTNYGRWDHLAQVDGANLRLDGSSVAYHSEKDPSQIPWRDYGVDVVLECTGFFTGENARAHIQGGAKRVIISSPSDPKSSVPTFVLGVNHESYRGEEVIANSSCTSNCVLPVVAVVDEAFKVILSSTTTIHSFTADQRLVDGPSVSKKPDLHRARAAANNIVPTSSGAGKSVGLLFPHLEGRTNALALRVPTPVVSVSDITFVLPGQVSRAALINLFRQAANSPRWEGILGVTDLPLVSSDFRGDPRSAIVDLDAIKADHDPDRDLTLAKVLAWYDNEAGYCVRMLDMAQYIGRSIE